MIYSNETKVKDIPDSHLKSEIETLLKVVMMDFGQILPPDIYSHTVNRLSYLIGMKYKALMMGEVKYVFEALTEDMNKISVQAIMKLFSKFYDTKIEKQRHEYEEYEQRKIENIHNCQKSPLGKAIIWKIQQREKNGKYPDIPIKEVAQKILSGEIKFNYIPGKAKRVIGIEQ